MELKDDSQYPVLTKLINDTQDLYDKALNLSLENATAEMVLARKGEIDLPTKIGKIDSKINDKVNVASLGASMSSDNGYGSANAGDTIFVTTNPRDFKANQGIRILGAGIGGADLVTVVTAINGLNFTLKDSIQTNVSHVNFQHDDTTPVQNAFNTGKTITGNGRVTTATITDNYGIKIEDELQVMKNGILYNSYADRGNRLVFGQEYLSYFHRKIIGGQSVNVVLTGDSTTAGSGITNTGFKLDTLFAVLTKQEGFNNLNFINRGQSGKSTVDWINTYLSGDMALNPDLLIIRWGANDGAGNGTVANFINALRQGLSTIRSTKDISKLSIILMSPNSMYEVAGTRRDVWFESIAPAIKRAARDFQCCFIDTYAFLQDSVNANDYMDKPFSYDNSHIHPKEIMNVWIADFIYNVMLPRSIRILAAKGVLSYITGTYDATNNPYGFQNNWNALGGFSRPAYWRGSDFVVNVQGVISGGTINHNDIICKLPYAPEYSDFYPCVTDQGYGSLYVKNSGEITINVLPVGTTWICLSGIRFHTPIGFTTLP